MTLATRKNRPGEQLYTREIEVGKFPMPVPETNSWNDTDLRVLK
jgi:hypothetical protein